MNEHAKKRKSTSLLSASLFSLFLTAVGYALVITSLAVPLNGREPIINRLLGHRKDIIIVAVGVVCIVILLILTARLIGVSISVFKTNRRR